MFNSLTLHQPTMAQLCSRRRKGQSGFTLAELMVVVAIIAIMSAMAVPTVTGIIAEADLREQSDAMMTDMRYARSMSLRRGTSVVMCASANSSENVPTCSVSAPNWASGWIIFIDNDNTTPPQHSATDELLRRKEDMLARSGGIDTGTGGAAGAPPAFIRFNNEGRVTGQQGSFILRASNESASLERAICLSSTGRPRVTNPGVTTC